MKILKFVKVKKIGLLFLVSFFILLIVSLVLRNIFSKTYPISIFFVVLIFILSQYFDFEYRYFISFALILLSTCPFLLIFKLNLLAEYFANYVYGFLVLGVVGYFFDNLREKLKSKVTIKIYKKVFLSILIIFLLSSALIFVRDYWRNTDYAVLIKENFVKFADSAKDKYLRTFRKDIYYSGLDVIEVDGKKISRDIIINIDNPKAGSNISKTIDLSGWAIETNSIDNTGIDKIEFFFDGIPGNGKYLGSFSIPYYKSDIETVKFLENLYLQFYNRKPFSSELDFWAINLEYNIMSYYDIAGNIINKLNFMDRSLSNEDFTSALYRGLLNKDYDGFWTDRLETDLTHADLLYIVINSEEFHKRSENYYESISIKENDLDIIRRDVGEKYGKQFTLSGFSFEFDSTKFNNGKYSLYIYARSPDFGWGYEVIDININN